MTRIIPLLLLTVLASDKCRGQQLADNAKVQIDISSLEYGTDPRPHIRQIYLGGAIGEVDEALWRLNRIHDRLISGRAVTGNELDLNFERSFGSTRRRYRQVWTNTLLSLPADSDSALEVYDLLRLDRHRATKNLYKTYEQLRSFRIYNLDVGTTERIDLRAKLTEALWSYNATDAKEEIERDFERLAELLRKAGSVPNPDASSSVDKQLKCSTRQLITKIPEDTAIVDIVRYGHISVEDPTSATPRFGVESRYAAFVLRNNKSPVRVSFGATKEIDNVIESWQKKVRIGGQIGSELTSSIYRMIWEPLKSSVGDVSNIYFVPDGSFHSVPWAALPTGQGRRLVEDFAVAKLFMVEAINLSTPDGISTKDAFRRPVVTFSGPNNDLRYASEVGDYLRGVLESDRVVSLGKNGVGNIQALCRQLSQSGIAHFATHGKFARNQLSTLQTQKILPSNSPQNSLIFSSLLLPSFNGSKSSDAVLLSGDIIVETDLQNLRLAVLAACESDSGDWEDGEGGFSLTRAFHLAGCRDVISTLWPVNDASTAAIMKRFYELILNGETTISALRQAQLDAIAGRLSIDFGDGATRDGKTFIPRVAKTQTPSAAKGKVKMSSDKWAGLVLSGPGRISVSKILSLVPEAGERQLAASEQTHRNLSFKIISLSMDDNERERRIGNAIQEWLQRTRNTDPTPEEIEEIRDDATKRVDRGQWVEARISGRVSDEEHLVNIAKDVRDKLNRSRDERMSISFRLPGSPPNTKVYAVVQLRGNWSNVEKLGLTESMHQSFVNCDFPCDGRSMGVWDAEHSVIQIVRIRQSYEAVEFFPDGTFKKTPIESMPRKRNVFSRPGRLSQYMAIERGKLVYYANYQNGFVERVCNPVPNHKLRESETERRRKLSELEKQRLRPYVEKLIALRDSEDFTQSSVREGGQHWEVYEELTTLEDGRLSQYLPFDLWAFPPLMRKATWLCLSSEGRARSSGIEAELEELSLTLEKTVSGP